MRPMARFIPRETLRLRYITERIVSPPPPHAMPPQPPECTRILDKPPYTHNVYSMIRPILIEQNAASVLSLHNDIELVDHYRSSREVISIGQHFLLERQKSLRTSIFNTDLITRKPAISLVFLQSLCIIRIDDKAIRKCMANRIKSVLIVSENLPQFNRIDIIFVHTKRA